ncbi:dihydroorotase [Metabacillus idriensis]|uniref:dihydroorotase n=1 Tax=Metabacillus idriensis TaxID=324768 RepID=UPI00174DC957|nr:dihydroorotase [Metabacillus idriensis]
MWDHVIRGGTIVTATEEAYEADVYIKDGKISAISIERLPGKVTEEIDARGCCVLPGLIDIHIHSRDPGASHKEDFYHSTQAAAIGGITTVFEMPNTNPPINNVENFHKQVDNLEQKAHVDFGVWAICLGRLNSEDLHPLNKAGVIGYKFFWGYAVNSKTFQLVYNANEKNDEVIPPFKDGEVYEIFESVSKTGKVLAIHAESNDIIQYLTQRYESSDHNDYNALLQTRSNLAEEITIQTGISFAKKTGVRLHILHMSTEEGVNLVKAAQKEGYNITSETCPHYLFLNNEDYNKIGSAMKVYPLVKYKKDQEKLWKGLEEGVISIVCSDHAPHTEEEKSGDLWSIPAGMCGVETLTSLMLDAVNKNRLTLQDLVAILSENPAKQFGIYPRKGSLLPGTDADITIVDLNKNSVIKKENLHSKSKITAFDGFELKGTPVATIVRGQMIMKDGKIVSKPTGKLIKPSNDNS